uniref:hypothetical protein n=1 Tax=Nonomuraea sp. CA-251285 TaxID=3240002 RepID=UPI003F492A19
MNARKPIPTGVPDGRRLLLMVSQQAEPLRDRLGITSIALDQTHDDPRVIIGFGPDREVIVEHNYDDCDHEHVQRYCLVAWQRKRGDHWLITMTSFVACGSLNPVAAEIGHALGQVVEQAAADPFPAKVSHRLTGSTWVTRAYRSLLPRSRA